MVDVDVKQIVGDLRQECANYCMAQEGRFVPVGMINDYDRLAMLSKVMVTLKQIGIDTKNREMRLMFWQKVFDVRIQSTDDIPRGYVHVFVNWVKNHPAVAEAFGQVYISWFEKNQPQQKVNHESNR
jgi:hypothetical protein